MADDKKIENDEDLNIKDLEIQPLDDAEQAALSGGQKYRRNGLGGAVEYHNMPFRRA